MIELSPAAAREIERWSQSRRLAGSYLRLAVKNGVFSRIKSVQSVQFENKSVQSVQSVQF